MLQRNVWINIHIPKCGGSTVVNILRQNFGAGFRDGRALLDTFQYTSSQVAEILNYHPYITCYSDHKLSMDLPFDLPNVRFHIMTFVRDPVDRFLSHYFYHRNHSDYVPQTKTMDLDQYIDWALVQRNQPMYINGQTRFLTECGNAQGLAKVQRLLESENVMIFPFSRFDE
ncbi:MAG: sulfotransferase family 2 domain-containing protein, partial [Deltaproteobacteria bacterium]|nr:sulfotransferase family 2 domain-containing protein [Deltaproteobacteria bacterium]